MARLLVVLLANTPGRQPRFLQMPMYAWRKSANSCSTLAARSPNTAHAAPIALAGFATYRTALHCLTPCKTGCSQLRATSPKLKPAAAWPFQVARRRAGYPNRILICYGWPSDKIQKRCQQSPNGEAACIYWRWHGVNPYTRCLRLVLSCLTLPGLNGQITKSCLDIVHRQQVLLGVLITPVCLFYSFNKSLKGAQKATCADFDTAVFNDC